MIFASAYHGGPYVEVFNSKGITEVSNGPGSKIKNLIKMQKPSKTYLKELRGYIFGTRGIELPASGRTELGLKQPFLVFQCALGEESSINIEIQVKTDSDLKKRLVFSDASSKRDVTTFHTKIPLHNSLPREEWVNLCLDLDSFLRQEDLRFVHISKIMVNCPMKIKSIFTLRQPIKAFDTGAIHNDVGAGFEKSKAMLPKGIALPIETYNIDINASYIDQFEGLGQTGVSGGQRMQGRGFNGKYDQDQGRFDDRSTKIATPNSFISGTKYSSRTTPLNMRKGSRSRNVKGKRGLRALGSGGFQTGQISRGGIPTQDFNFEFKSTGKMREGGGLEDRGANLYGMSSTTQAVRGQNRKTRGAINGMRVIQSKDNNSRRRTDKMGRKPPKGLAQTQKGLFDAEDDDNRMVSVGEQKLRMRQAAKQKKQSRGAMQKNQDSDILGGGLVVEGMIYTKEEDYNLNQEVDEQPKHQEDYQFINNGLSSTNPSKRKSPVASSKDSSFGLGTQRLNSKRRGSFAGKNKEEQLEQELFDELEKGVQKETQKQTLNMKFNSTGDQQEYFKNNLNVDYDDFSDNIEDEVDGSTVGMGGEYNDPLSGPPQKFQNDKINKDGYFHADGNSGKVVHHYEEDSGSVDGERQGQMDQTVRLDKFSKKVTAPIGQMDDFIDQVRHTNMVDLDDFEVHQDSLQDSLEVRPRKAPVKDITTFVEELIGSTGAKMRPFSPPATNLIDLVETNKTVITEKQGDKVILDFSSNNRQAMEDSLFQAPKAKEENVSQLNYAELEYDPTLDCYYDPKTNTYHSKQQQRESSFLIKLPKNNKK